MYFVKGPLIVIKSKHEAPQAYPCDISCFFGGAKSAEAEYLHFIPCAYARGVLRRRIKPN